MCGRRLLLSPFGVGVNQSDVNRLSTISVPLFFPSSRHGVREGSRRGGARNLLRTTISPKYPLGRAPRDRTRTTVAMLLRRGRTESASRPHWNYCCTASPTRTYRDRLEAARGLPLQRSSDRTSRLIRGDRWLVHVVAPIGRLPDGCADGIAERADEIFRPVDSSLSTHPATRPSRPPAPPLCCSHVLFSWRYALPRSPLARLVLYLFMSFFLGCV